MRQGKIGEDAKSSVLVDFLELDHMRESIGEFFKEHRNKDLPRRLRAPYDRSAFFIGRYVTRFSFRGLRMSPFTVHKLVDYLRKDFDYKYFMVGWANSVDLCVYLRYDEKYLSKFLDAYTHYHEV